MYAPYYQQIDRMNPGHSILIWEIIGYVGFGLVLGWLLWKFIQEWKKQL